MVSGVEASSHGKTKEWLGGSITREMQASRHWKTTNWKSIFHVRHLPRVSRHCRCRVLYKGGTEWYGRLPRPRREDDRASF